MQTFDSLAQPGHSIKVWKEVVAGIPVMHVDRPDDSWPFLRHLKVACYGFPYFWLVEEATFVTRTTTTPTMVHTIKKTTGSVLESLWEPWKFFTLVCWCCRLWMTELMVRFIKGQFTLLRVVSSALVHLIRLCKNLRSAAWKHNLRNQLLAAQ